MQKLLTTICVMVVMAITFGAYAVEERPYWERPEVYAINKLTSRATLTPYASFEEALQRGASPYVQSIGGEWKFHWTATPSFRGLPLQPTQHRHTQASRSLRDAPRELPSNETSTRRR